MSAPAADDEPASASASAEPPAVAVAEAAVAADADPSCSVASLRQYYDECADFYDHADEGEEDTYICVDRVTSSLLAALHRLGDDGAGAAAAGDDALAPSLSPSAHSARAITDGTLDSPIPLPCIGALGLLGEDETEEDGAEGGARLRLMMLPLQSPTPDAEGDAPAAEGSPSLEAAAASVEAETSTSLASDATESPRSAASPSPSPVPSLRSPSSAWPPCLSVNVSAGAAARAGAATRSQPLRVLDLGVGTGLASRPLFAALSTPPLRVPRRGGSGADGKGAVCVPPGTVLPEIWGVDLSPGMLRVSSVLPFAHLVAADLNTPLWDASLHPRSPLARPAALAYFDMCVCVGTTEFVRDHAAFLGQVRAFLRPGGLFCGTFPSTRSQTYPGMSCVDDEELLRRWVESDERDSDDCGKRQGPAQGRMVVLEVQRYRGWSVSAEEHIEYIQVLAQKLR